MRRAVWPIVAAWFSCAGALACTSFSTDDGAADVDAGDEANVPLVDGSIPEGAAVKDASREAGPGEIFFDAFDSPGLACDGWLSDGVTGTKKDKNDGGRVCEVCAASSNTTSLSKEVSVTAPGTYTLTGRVRNLTANDIDSRVMVFYGGDAAGTSDISPSINGPAQGQAATMQASRASTRPLTKVKVSYRLSGVTGGCIEIDDVLLEHTP